KGVVGREFLKPPLPALDCFVASMRADKGAPTSVEADVNVRVSVSVAEAGSDADSNILNACKVVQASRVPITGILVSGGVAEASSVAGERVQGSGVGGKNSLAAGLQAEPRILITWVRSSWPANAQERTLGGSNVIPQVRGNCAAHLEFRRGHLCSDAHVAS